MVAQTTNPSTCKTEAGRAPFCGHLGLHEDTLKERRHGEERRGEEMRIEGDGDGGGGFSPSGSQHGSSGKVEG